MFPWLSNLFRFRTADIGPAILIFIVLTLGVVIVAFSGNGGETPPEEELAASLPMDTVRCEVDSIRTLSLKQMRIDSTNRELSRDYVGPPKHIDYQPKRRIPEGATIDLNRADSATLTLVPGIGPAFSRRIVALRERLGGFYTVLQLQEVYGMTPDRFRSIKPYFVITSPPERRNVARVAYDSIPRHPYLSYEQYNALQRLLFRDGELRGWGQLLSLDCFTRDDSVRLSHYFIFE